MVFQMKYQTHQVLRFLNTSSPQIFAKTYNHSQKPRIQCSVENDENECGITGAPYIYPGYNNVSQYHCRSIYQSMVNLLDVIVGNITERLKYHQLWNNTLFVFASDNGGPVGISATAANNHPLRGGKFSQWEGGIRSASFVSGGYLPETRYGMIEHGIIHISDWYSTFSAMIGVDPFDTKAEKAGLPPIDGYNMWPMISGKNLTSPRTEIVINNYINSSPMEIFRSH
jgi:arylsulfatase I/J